MKLKAESGYRMAIRNAVRGLWKGVIDFDQAFGVMLAAIDRYIPQAWRAGAKEGGIRPAEMSKAERQAMAQVIAREKDFVFGFLDHVERNSQANDGKLTPLFKRANAWILRYKDAKNRALQMVATDPKLKWIWDPIKEHCNSCYKLNGKIKRASFWRERGIRPQSPPNPLLECNGFLCGCIFRVTDEPMSKGPLPSLP